MRQRKTRCTADRARSWRDRDRARTDIRDVDKPSALKRRCLVSLRQRDGNAGSVGKRNEFSAIAINKRVRRADLSVDKLGRADRAAPARRARPLYG